MEVSNLFGEVMRVRCFVLFADIYIYFDPVKRDMLVGNAKLNDVRLVIF